MPWVIGYSRVPEPPARMMPLRALIRGSSRSQPFQAVTAVQHALHPQLVGQVPVDGVCYPTLESLRRRPAEFALQLARVDGVATVVAGAVLDEGDQRLARPSIREGPAGGEQGTNGFDYRQVFALGVPTHVVGLAYAARVEYAPD